jgi:hypothetical protein
MIKNNLAVETLLAEINEHIDLCDSQKTPTLCAMRAAERPQMLSLIYDIVVLQGVSISEAMAEIESSFSLNSPE